MSFVGNLSLFPAAKEKNFANRSNIDKVIAIVRVAQFFYSQFFYSQFFYSQFKLNKQLLVIMKLILAKGGKRRFKSGQLETLLRK